MIDIDVLKEELDELNQVIYEETNVLLSNEGRISKLELDIVMGNMRKMYERYAMLSYAVDEALLQEAPKKEETQPQQVEESAPAVAAPVEEHEESVQPKVEEPTPAVEEPAVEPTDSVAAEPAAEPQPEVSEPAAENVNAAAEVVFDFVNPIMPEATPEKEPEATPTPAVAEPIIDVVTPSQAEPVSVVEPVAAEAQQPAEPVQQPETVVPEQPAQAEPTEGKPAASLFDSEVFSSAAANAPEAPKSEPHVSIADTLKPAGRSVLDDLNDKAATNSVAAKIGQTPIASLKSIALNDRFQITRELFANHSEMYMKTINALDETESEEQAMSMLDQLGQKFEWDFNSNVYLKFAEYVRRRFL